MKIRPDVRAALAACSAYEARLDVPTVARRRVTGPLSSRGALGGGARSEGPLNAYSGFGDFDDRNGFDCGIGSRANV